MKMMCTRVDDRFEHDEDDVDRVVSLKRLRSGRPIDRKRNSRQSSSMKMICTHVNDRCGILRKCEESNGTPAEGKKKEQRPPHGGRCSRTLGSALPSDLENFRFGLGKKKLKVLEQRPPLGERRSKNFSFRLRKFSVRTWKKNLKVLEQHSPLGERRSNALCRSQCDLSRLEDKS